MDLILQTSAAQESGKMVLLAYIILLVVEGGVLVPLAFMYMYWVIRTITIERVSLYSIFLRVPRPTVVAISKAEVRLVGEDGFDDDDEPAVSPTNWSCMMCIVAHLRLGGRVMRQNQTLLCFELACIAAAACCCSTRLFLTCN